MVPAASAGGLRRYLQGGKVREINDLALLGRYGAVKAEEEL